MVEISSAENQYLGRMRELDSFARDEFDIQIIDQDFAPEHTPQANMPDSLSGFDSELKSLQEQIDSGPTGSSEGLLLRNLESARTVIGVLAGETVIGKTVSYEDFVEKTMGLRPEKISKRDLRRQKNEVAESISRLEAGRGLPFAYSEDDREDFHDEYTVGPGELEYEINGLSEVMRSDIAKTMGKTSLSGEEMPTVEAVVDENLWQGYFGYDKDQGFFIRANTHPDIKISLFEERAILAHEGGHWASSAIKRRGIQTGELSPALGILPVFSPAYTQDEIIARTVESYIFHDWNSDFATYLYKKFKYENDVYNNMLIEANSGVSLAEVSVNARMYLPFEEPDKIRKSAKLFSENLIFKTVFGVDAYTIRIGREIASLPDEERRATLKRLCTQPLSPEELLKIGK